MLVSVLAFVHTIVNCHARGGFSVGRSLRTVVDARGSVWYNYSPPLCLSVSQKGMDSTFRSTGTDLGYCSRSAKLA